MTDNTSQNTAQARRVVVLGGTGRVGEGIVREWAAAGAQVIVPSRTQERADELTALLHDSAYAENVHTIITDYTDFDGAEKSADLITETFGAVTDVVASIGGWWQGTAPWQTTDAIWQRFFVDLTTAHMANVAAWVPRLPADGAYQLILGGSGTTPVPRAGVINMEQAALLMMSQTITLEAADQRRVFALILGPVATRGRDWVDPSWVTGADVGAVTLAQALSSAPSAQVPVRTGADAAARVTEVAA